jgi:hypothetical protein
MAENQGQDSSGIKALVGTELKALKQHLSVRSKLGQLVFWGLCVWSAYHLYSEWRPHSMFLGNPTVSLDAVAGTSGGYVVADTLTGTIVKSSDSSDVGRKFTFIGLDSNSPKVVVELGGEFPTATWTLQKVRENEMSMTLLMTRPVDRPIDKLLVDVDVIVIDKTTGKFAWAAAGAGTLSGHNNIYAAAAVGTGK